MRSNFREFGSGKRSQGLLKSFLKNVRPQSFFHSTNAPVQGRKNRSMYLGYEKTWTKDAHIYSELRRTLEW